MIPLKNNANVDNSNPADYPDGRVKDNTGSGNGTPVDRQVYGDLHSNISKLMRLYGIAPNELPDNETIGYQIIEALRALASKNDFILDLTSSTGILNVPIKLALMLEGEQVVCKANVGWTAETTIKGTDNTPFAFTRAGNFKIGEFVRLIKTSSGITLVRLADNYSIDAFASELKYLKKASQSEENAGVIDTVSTTPLVNKVAFTKRVTGTDSPTYLATHTNNGLMSKEQWDIINGLGASPTRNIGNISGVDVNGGAIGSTYTPSGNIVSGTLTAKGSSVSIIRIVMQNTMTDSNYFVRIHIQSLSADTIYDRNLFAPVFAIVNATTFDIVLHENSPGTQNLKIHLEAVKY